MNGKVQVMINPTNEADARAHADEQREFDQGYNDGKAERGIRR